MFPWLKTTAPAENGGNTRESHQGSSECWFPGLKQRSISCLRNRLTVDRLGALLCCSLPEPGLMEQQPSRALNTTEGKAGWKASTGWMI